MSKPIRLVATLALMTFLGMSAAVGQDATQDVRNAVLGFSTAWNHHDMVAFGKLFAPDADFVNVQGKWWKGRESIQLHHAWAHGVIAQNTFPHANPAYFGIFKHSTIKFIQIDVHFLRKDVAIAHVNWELLGDARTSSPRNGVLTFVLTRQNGGWLIAAAQNTEINRVVH